MPGPPAIIRGQADPSQRLLSRRSCARRWNAGLAQHFNHVEVIHLPGDGKGPDVKIICRAPAFEREQGLAGRGRALLPENTLADYVRFIVQPAVQQLKCQAAHANVIAVGKGQRDGEAAPPVLDDRAFLQWLAASLRARDSGSLLRRASSIFCHIKLLKSYGIRRSGNCPFLPSPENNRPTAGFISIYDRLRKWRSPCATSPPQSGAGAVQPPF